MKELVVLSGKGGTGKTSLTGAFAALSANSILCDADVDAADLHLLMNPSIKRQSAFEGGGIAVIDPEKCTACGRCRELCRFGAIDTAYKVKEFYCEGCGVCFDFCPEAAIAFPRKTCGEWFVSETRFGQMVHARLGIAEENSGKLVTLVRQEAKTIAEQDKIDLIITDGPPGIGCPVIASLGGASALVIVAEPTVSGIHDMKRVAELAGHFRVPSMVLVNKSDLNPDQTERILKIAQQMQIEVLGRLPFDSGFTESMVQGKTIVEYQSESATALAIKDIWKKIMSSAAMNDKSS